MEDEAITKDPVPFVRRIPFGFPDDIAPHWHPEKPEWSHMITGGSLTMPYLEPFLIETMREALEQIDDPDARAEGIAFMAQEGQHFRHHRQYNELMKSKGYSELAEFETQMERDYEKLRSRSLRHRMAYTAGFETMTLAFTRWLVRERVYLFQGADARVASFILWHMVEETEHKRVAHKIYQIACPGYWSRAWGVFHAGWHVIHYTRKTYHLMLKKDGLWADARSRWITFRLAMRFLVNVAPPMLATLLPGHDPARQGDPDWVSDWIENYKANADSKWVPLLDTNSADLPPPQPQH
jgi:predicted metal-dependent hydrolase